jgi:hypothetical protein
VKFIVSLNDFFKASARGKFSRVTQKRREKEENLRNCKSPKRENGEKRATDFGSWVA